MMEVKTKHRDLIGKLLLSHIEFTDAHPGLMLCAVGLAIVLGSCLQGAIS